MLNSYQKNLIIAYFIVLLFPLTTSAKTDVSLNAFSIDDIERMLHSHYYDVKASTQIRERLERQHIPYLATIIDSTSQEINKGIVFELLKQLSIKYRDEVLMYEVDRKAIQFIENNESSSNLEYPMMTAIYYATQLLGIFRNESSMEYLRNRFNVCYWKEKRITVLKDDNVFITDEGYQSQMREAILHALFSINDNESIDLIQEFDVDSSDPNYIALHRTWIDKYFDIRREKAIEESKSLLDKRKPEAFDALYTARVYLEGYRIGHGDYPRTLQDVSTIDNPQEIPLDPFGTNQKLLYKKTSNGFKLWSVGLNGKTDEPGAKDFDDIVVQYP